jgi:2-methylcitrate dehydratase PrpD
MLTRRSLLERSIAFGTATFPLRRALAAQSISPTMATLSAYMSEASSRALPLEVIEKAKHHILDTLAAIVSGAQLPPGEFAIRYARARSGDKIATVAASDVVCGPIEAAFANAMLAHSDETDDSHAPSQSHPGCSVVPAALAVGEQFGIDGTRFIRAVALGYDIGTRVTMTIGSAGFQSENHLSTHSVAGTFGSAAAAASAAGLNTQQMRWVLDYAAQQASGIKAWQRDTDHIEKAFVFAGGPARNGVTAAEIVQSGGTGVDDVLSGQDNFLVAYAPRADASKLVEKLGERYEVVRTNIKKWSVGSPIQAPLDALENLRKKRAFEAGQVKAAIVRLPTSEAALVNNREMPDICLQYMIAVTLLDKTASFRSSHDKARMSDAAVERERAKVQLVGDEALERRLPNRSAIVELTLTDGTRLTEQVDAVRGTAENPMSRDEVLTKSRDLIAPVLGSTACAKLVDRMMDLENVKNVRELRPLLQRA